MKCHGQARWQGDSRPARAPQWRYPNQLHNTSNPFEISFRQEKRSCRPRPSYILHSFLSWLLAFIVPPALAASILSFLPGIPRSVDASRIFATARTRVQILTYHIKRPCIVTHLKSLRCSGSDLVPFPLLRCIIVSVYAQGCVIVLKTA
jgi:hypothetical protein